MPTPEGATTVTSDASREPQSLHEVAGELRKNLISEGFTPDEAFQIVLLTASKEWLR